MSRTGQTPEGALLHRARTRRRPKVSIRQAAARAGVSESLWRSVEAGYTTPSAGVRIPKAAPADTYAHMAHAVGISPDEITSLEAETPEDQKRLAEAALLLREIGHAAGPLVRAARESLRQSIADVVATMARTRPAGTALSAAEWEAIERGAQAPTDTQLAAMAAITATDPSELENAGQPEAARLLREIISRTLPAKDDAGRAELMRIYDASNAEQRRVILIVARAQIADEPAARYGTTG